MRRLGRQPIPGADSRDQTDAGYTYSNISIHLPASYLNLDTASHFKSFTPNTQEHMTECKRCCIHVSPIASKNGVNSNSYSLKPSCDLIVSEWIINCMHEVYNYTIHKPVWDNVIIWHQFTHLLAKGVALI